jgi:tRNA (guanine37-N1)-methyltransferase
MDFDVITIFPGMFEAPLAHGIVQRAIAAGRVRVRLWDLRDHTADRHRKVDDTPYGGGGGMVLRPEPVFGAVAAVRAAQPVEPSRTILLCPQGTPYTQREAERLLQYRRLILICGRYEGVDERVREHLADESISIGDYVLTGGEIPALAIIDSVTRLQPGAIGDAEAARQDSFSSPGLGYPQYTRPPEFLGHRVPEVLLSGDHGAIARWRRDQAQETTRRKRPDLLVPPRPLSGPGTRQDH